MFSFSSIFLPNSLVARGFVDVNMKCVFYGEFCCVMRMIKMKIVVYPHHNHNDISIQRYMNKFKYREIHNTLTGELTVVQIRTFINFWISEFGSSTRGERETQFLKVFRNHLNLTKLPNAWYDPTNVQRIPLCLRSLSVEVCRTPWSELNFSTPWS